MSGNIPPAETGTVALAVASAFPAFDVGQVSSDIGHILLAQVTPEYQLRIWVFLAQMSLQIIVSLVYSDVEAFPTRETFALIQW